MIGVTSVALFAGQTVLGANYYWDSDGIAAGDNVVLGTSLGGAGSWDTSSLLWYNSATNSDVAWPNSLSDTAIFTGTAGTVTLAGAGVNAGSLQFLTTGYTLGGAALTLGGTGSNVFVGSSITASINSVIAGSNGLGVYGPGTLNLTGLNSYTGNTSISNGATLNLDFTTNATDIINNTSPLVFNGGTLKLSGVSGATDSQTFASTSVAGNAVITLTQNSATSLTVNLGAITQTAGGTLNFSAAPSASVIANTTSSNDASGILGTWATVGTGTAVRYATVSGGAIAPYTGATAATANLANLTSATTNYSFTGAAATLAGNLTANTLQFTSDTVGRTIALGANTLTLNGILNTSSQVYTISGTGTIAVGANNDLVISGSNSVTISSAITGTGKNLIYNGTAGALTLNTTASTFTGTTYVNSGGGSVALSLANVLNSASSLVVNGGTIGQTTFAQSLAAVTLRAGTINGTTGLLTSAAAFDLQSGTVSAAMAGTNGLNKTTAGTVTLSPTTAGTLGGAINIKAGTLVMGGTAVVSFAGTNTINLGESGTSADARLAVSNTQATYANPIVLTTGATGNLSIGNQGTTAITFNNATTVTGTNNLFIGNTSSGGLTLTNVNNTGAVVNAGSGSGTTTITTLGTSVNSITQAGVSPLTITNAVSGTAVGNLFSNTGTGLFTLTAGPSSGTNLVFNTTSTGGITVTGAMSGPTGTITGSGTGTGIVTLTAAIPSTITNIIQNGAGTLTLTSGANAYTGTTTVTQGTLSFAGTPATGATSGLGNATSNIILGGASTLGILNYTGAAATMTRNVTINAGGGQINSTTATLTITPGAAIDLTNGPLTIGGANNVTIGSATTTTAAFTGTNSLTKVGAGTLTLSDVGGNVFTSAVMPINITAGTLALLTTNVNTTNILGSGLITITPGATFSTNFGGAGATTLANAFTIAAAAGTANISVGSGAFQDATGAITFAAGSTAATILRLSNSNTTTTTLNLGGTVSGTGSIQLNSSGASGSPIILSGPQNQTGSITNVGTASGNTSTTSLASTATIGSGITAITQSGTNPFTVAAAVPLSATLNTFASTNSGTFTFTGGFTGAQPLTFNSSSTGAITVSTGAINNGGNVTFNSNGNGNYSVTSAMTNTGTITNSGTGGGTTTISGNISSNVTNVVQSSANTQFILSGTNTYTGSSTVTAGILDFTTTSAIPAYSTSPATAFGRIAVAAGATLILPYGGTSSVTATDITNLFNGTYNVFAAGSSFGLDTTNASPTPAVLSSVLADPGGAIGALNFTKSGANALTVGSANTYTGWTAIVNGTLNASIINSVNGGTPTFAASSLGAPTTVSNGTIRLGFGTTTGTLSYTGNGETTDRVIDLAGNTGGGGIDNSGLGTLTFSNSPTFSGIGAKSLTFSGASNISFTAPITGNFSTGTSPLTINKIGTGTLTLSGANTATTLIVGGGTVNTGTTGLTLNNTTSATIQTTGATAGSTVFINGKIIFVGVGALANGADVGATVAGVTLDLTGAVLAGTVANANVDFFSAGTTVLGNANTYQGQTQISGTTLVVTSLGTANGAAPSSLGQPAAGNSVTGNLYSTILATSGVLKYVGTGETTDRALDLRGTTTATTIDQSGTGLLKFTGVNTAAGAGAKTMTLQGSTTGTGEISGPIVDNTTTNTTGITKAGTGKWTLSGVNTYTGATTVNGGNLVLSTPGSLSNTAITINNGGTFSPLAGTVAGSSAAGTAGAKLTLNSGGTLNLADGVVGNFTVNQQASFVAATVGTFAGGSIVFDLSSAASDQISFPSTLGTVTSSGANAISINPISGSLTAGTYTLINSAAAGSSLSNANFYLASPNLVVGGTLYNLSLSGTGGTEVLTVATGGAAAAPNTAYWQGAQADGKWNTQTVGFTTNWATSALGNVDTFALPASTTNVIFTANSATNLITTLEQNFTINSLTFTGGGTANSAGATIASGTGTNSLTINAAALNGNAAGNGISVSATAGADTISANVILGASQTWTNNSTTGTLTISGVVSDGGSNFNLTTAGAGTTSLTNSANTYGGISTINGGVLRVSTLANGGLASSIGQSSNAAGNLVFGATSSLQYTGGSVAIDRNFTINAGVIGTIDVTQAGTNLALTGVTGAVTTGALTKAGVGTLTLNGAQTYTGNTLVTNGTLNIAGTGSLTGLAASSKLNINPTAGNNAVANYSSSATSTLFAITGANVAGTASAYNQSNGVVNLTPGTTTGTQGVVNANSAYGYYNITGGTLKDTGRFTLTNQGTASATNGTGTGVQTGVVFVGGTGTIDHTSTEWFLSYGLGQVTVADSGKIDRTGSTTAAPYGIIMNTATGVTGGGYGVLNLSGSGAQVLLGAGGMKFGNATTAGQGDGLSAFVNLGAGTLSTGVISAVSMPAAPTATNFGYWNYTGGTMKATAALSTGWAPASAATITFIHTIYGAVNNSAVSGAPSFNGGLTVDTNNFAVTIPAAMPLLGASGYRVTQSDLTVSGGSGYIGAPAVIFSKPASASGVPAAGYALISGGSVVGIVITDPGVYASGETPTITLVGGGSTTAATVTSVALTTANSNTGGLTKINSGTLTMSGAANTFGGVVDIKGGLLTVTTLANGGVASTLGASSNAASNLLLDGGFLGYSGTVAGTTDRNFTLAASNSGLDASGTTAGTFTLTSANSMTVASNLGAANFILQGTGTGTAGSGSLGTLIADGSSTTVSLIKNGTGTWNVTNSANTYTGSTTINGGILSVAKLANGGSNSSIGASSNAASNLVLNGGTLLYTGSGDTTNRNYTFGNATTASGATIDSSGTGALVIGGSMTAINAAANTQVLTLNAAAGTGNNTISGIVDSNTGTGALTGVTKTGAGTWIIGAGSTYTGATTISSGTLGVASGVTTLGGSLTMAAGAGLTMSDGLTNTVTVSGAATLAPASGATTSLTFDINGLSNGVNDVLAIGGAGTVGAGTTTIFLNGIGVDATVGNSYTIITAGSGLNPANFVLGNINSRVIFGATAYQATLSGTATTETVTLGVGGLALAYFTGNADSTTLNATIGGGTVTNFATDITGATDTVTAPNSFTDVFFTASTVTSPTIINTLGQNTTFNSLNFTSGAPAVTINESGAFTLSLVSGINVASGSAAQTINVPLILSTAAQTITNNSSNLLTIGGGVTAGSNALTFAGSGATTLSGASAFTTSSNVTVNSGAGAVTISSPITLGGASTFSNNSSNLFSISGNVTNGGFALTTGGTGNTNISGAISGSGGLTKVGTGTTTLSVAQNYAGPTVISTGTLASTADQSLSSGLTFGIAAGDTTNGALDLSSANATFTGALTVQTNSATNNTITIGPSKTLTVNGGMTVGYSASSGSSTTSKLTATGGGSMAVNGTNLLVGVDITGAVNSGWFNKATLDVSGLASFSTNVTNFNIGSGGTSAPTGNVILSNTANNIIATTMIVGNTGGNNGNGTSTLTLGAGTNTIQANTINIGLGKGSGPGVVTFASQTAGSLGTVTIANKAGTGAANITVGNNNGTVTGGGAIGTLDLRGHTATVNAGTLLIASNNNTSTGPVQGTVSFDAGNFTVATINMAPKTAAGVALAQATLNVGGGNFTVNTAFTLGSQVTAGTSQATLNLTGGTFTSNVAITQGGGATTSTISLNGASAILDMTAHNIGSSTNLITLDTKVGTLQNIGLINTSAGVTKTTTGTLTLTGTNTFTGGVSLTGTAGQLNINSSTALGATPGTFNIGVAGTVLDNTSGADITLANNNAQTWGANFTFTGTNSLNMGTGAVALGSSTRQVTVSNNTLTEGGVISGSTGSVGLTKAGNGVLALTGASNYTGPTTVTAGNLQVGAGGVLGGTTGTGSVTSAVSATSTTFNTTATVSGSDYQNVAVSNQKIVVGPTVSGTGTITGNVTIGTGTNGLSVGVLSPGDNGGTTNGQINITGNLVISNGSQIRLQLASSSSVDNHFDYTAITAKTYLDGITITSQDYIDYWKSPVTGSSYDSVKVTGGITLGTGGSATYPTILVTAGSSPSFGLGGIYKLFDWSTVATPDSLKGTGSFALGTDFVLPDLQSGTSGLFWDTSAFTTYGVVVIVPEPSRALLFFFGLVALVTRRRRK